MDRCGVFEDRSEYRIRKQFSSVYFNDLHLMCIRSIDILYSFEINETVKVNCRGGFRYQTLDEVENVVEPADGEHILCSLQDAVSTLFVCAFCFFCNHFMISKSFRSIQFYLFSRQFRCDETGENGLVAR